MTFIKKCGKGALKTLQSVAYAMSKEESRYYLCGINLEVVKGKATLTATNGHELATIPLHDWYVSGEDCNIIIPASLINKIIGLKPKQFIEISEKNNDWFVTIDDGIKIDFKPIEGTFPDYRRCLPKEPIMRVKLRKSYLQNLLKNMPNDDVILDIVDSSAPVSVSTAEGSQFIIMPVRM